MDERADKSYRIYPEDVKDESEFDGSNTDKRKRLVRDREKLTGWKTEYDKTEDNSEAAHDNDGLLRPTRMRFYNLRDVIVEQVILLTFTLTIGIKYYVIFSVYCSTDKEKHLLVTSSKFTLFPRYSRNVQMRISLHSRSSKNIE